MKLKIIIVLAAVLNSVGVLAKAPDVCMPRATDICEIADGIVAEMHKNIPMKVSQNVSMTSAFSVNKTVNLVVDLSYNEAYLVNILKKNNGSMKQVKTVMETNTRNFICSSELTGAFVGLGGEVTYIYKYNNGMKFIEIDIKNCNE